MNVTANNLREDRDWLKVSELSVGMQIAVPKAECFAAFGVGGNDAGLEPDSEDVLWDEIEEIRELPEEQVWDIEVEGTHNFVAGHLIDKKTGNQLSAKEEKAYCGVDGGAGLDAWFGGIYAHNTYLDGDLGIGTATPGAKLSILDQTSELRDVFSVATSTSNTIFRVDTAGDAYAQGAFNSGGADYAEHFYADSADLAPGEVVCVSLENENAVARCIRPRDGNIMGIVSTNPAIVGNAGNIAAQQASAVVGMLGQVPAKVSNENGPIRPGDSLTSASIAGYAMKADPGDPTVGVALERLDAATGVVRVLISRRNKSLTVEQVEEAVVDRIAAMEIEDEVALLVSDAVAGYDFDPVVSNIIGTELALLEQDFDLRLSDEIAALAALIEANKLELIEESTGLVAINTNLTVTGSLESFGGIVVPLAGANSTTTPPAFKVTTDGTVVAYSDFVLSDGTNSTSIKAVLAELLAEDMTKTNLTVTQDLYVGNSFEVMGAQLAHRGGGVAGATVKRPIFKIALDGTVSVREDLVLAGYTQWNNIPGIVSVVAYNTADDLDGGSWIAGNRSASWYTEAIDATSDSCDLTVNDRCGLRSFPKQAIIAATVDSIYIFNSQDGSLWKKINRHAELVSASGSDNGPITTLHAADGALYIAQEGTVAIIDFSNDTIQTLKQKQILKQVQDDVVQGDEGSITSSLITDIHTQRINGQIYLAISGDQGVDLVNLSDGSSRHAELVSASDVRLTASGDLWAVASSTLSVFNRAYNSVETQGVETQGVETQGVASLHSPDATYTASSTLSGLYVSQDGNTAYTASGSEILVFTLDRHPELVSGPALNQKQILKQTQILKQVQDDVVQNDDSVSSDTITSFTIDEQAQVIYAAYQGGVKALALGNGTELASYESGQTSWGDTWTLSGAVHVASLTLNGPVREGELLSDTLVIATSEGLLAQAGDYSLRSSLASGFSGGNAPREQSNRLTVTNEALFSGRIMVTDRERLPLFALDEVTGNTIVREDIVFSSDASMQSIPTVSSVFVYDTELDSDGGAWTGAFPRKTMLAATGSTVKIYNSRTKELWGTYASEGIASIAGLAAKDGALALFGDEGLVLVDLASGEEGVVQSVEDTITSIAFDRDGELYYATSQEVYKIRHPELVSEPALNSIQGSVLNPIQILNQTQILKQVQDDVVQNDGVISGIALIKNNLYIANEDGITAVDLITQETQVVGEFSAVTSIATASYNTLLVAYADEVAEITEQGDIINTWTNEQARKDRNNQAYLASSIASVSASNGAYAIALEAPSGGSFVWMETSEQSLAEMLAAPRTVFTVIDRINTPRIASVSSLSFTASSTISFITSATTTPSLIVTESGKVGIGTTTPEFMLDVAGDSRFLSITSREASLGTTTASQLKVTEGYFQMKPLEGAPLPQDCDSADEYGRMAFDSQSETLYLCGPSGFRAFEPAAVEEPIVEEEPIATSTPEEL